MLWHWLRAKDQPGLDQPVSRGIVWSYNPARRFVLQVSCNFWKSTHRVWTASESNPLHIPPPGPAETSFITCSLAWSLLAHTALLPFCGLWQRQLTKLLPTPDRSMITQHWAADVISFKYLLSSWRLFLQSSFFQWRRKHSSCPSGHNPIYQSWIHLLWLGTP